MAFAVENKFMYLRLDLDANKVGNEGCQFLAKTDWPFLKGFKLSKNNIGSEGIKHLRKAKWPLLEIIEIGKIIEMEVII